MALAALAGYSCEDFPSRTSQSDLVRYLALFGLFSVIDITEKRPNKAKYLTGTCIKLKSVKMTSMSDRARVAPDLLKALIILSDLTIGRSAVDPEDLKPYWKWHISLGD